MNSVHAISLKVWLPVLFLSMFCLLILAITWQSYQLAESTIVQSSTDDIKQDLSNLQREMESAFRKNLISEAMAALSARGTNNYYQTLLVTDGNKPTLD